MRVLMLIAAIGLASLARPGIVRAAPPPAGRGPGLVDLSRWNVPLGSAAVLALPGELDAFAQQLGEVPIEQVDARGGKLPSDGSAFVRLRLAPSLTVVDPGRHALFNAWRLASEVDLLRDWWLVGDGREALRADPRGRAATGLLGQRLSQLYAAASGSYLAVQLGLVRSRWGLGLISNAGDDATPHTSESPFGVALQGDHVVRLGVSAFPLGSGLARPPLTTSLAFDAVIDDDTARWSDGDRAYQFIAAVQGQTETLNLGLYAAHRTQDNAEGGTTEVTAIDLTGKVVLAKEASLRAFLEGELAAIRGRTSLPLSVMREGAFNVDQLGGLGRFAVESGPFLGVLEVGFSSGDTNPFDDEQRAFAMDRDHRVGLLLFRELVMAASVVTVDNIADQDYRAEPPRGSDHLATSGAVRGAFYANPRVSFELAKEIHVYAGFVYAAADGQVVDPFWSGLAGGAPRGFRNGPPATELGWELDLGISMRIAMEDLMWRLRLEGAWCSPGAAFDDEAGRAAADIGGIWGQAGLVW